MKVAGPVEFSWSFPGLDSTGPFLIALSPSGKAPDSYSGIGGSSPSGATELRQMLPTLAQNDNAQVGGRYSVFAGKLGSRASCRARGGLLTNLNHILIGKLGIAVGFPRILLETSGFLSPLFHAVVQVVGGRAKKKVLVNVDAYWIIAFVANEHKPGYLSVPEFPCESVDGVFTIADKYSTVTVFSYCASPEKTSGRGVVLGPISNSVGKTFPLKHHLGSSSKPEMVNVDTLSDSASMANEKPTGNRSVKKLPHESVGTSRSAVDGNEPMPPLVCRTSPKEASGIRLRDTVFVQDLGDVCHVLQYTTSEVAA